MLSGRARNGALAENRGRRNNTPAMTPASSANVIAESGAEAEDIRDAPATPGYSVEYGMSAICRARRIAVRTLRWHGAQVPNMRRGRIFARSGMNARRSLVFL